MGVLTDDEIKPFVLESVRGVAATKVEFMGVFGLFIC
jgi:hypothetical protein